jgi:hypothetical protein
MLFASNNKYSGNNELVSKQHYAKPKKLISLNNKEK